MPVVNLNRKTFEKIVGRKLSQEKLAERMAMLGTDVREINEKEIIVEVFPDRPDLLSEQGFARAFVTFIEAEKGLKKYHAKKSSYKLIVDESVKEVRPFTVCCVVKNLKLDDEKIREIIQIQEKLHITYGRNRQKAAIGIYPLEKIKWPITYLAKKPSDIFFKPLGSKFPMNAKDILLKNPIGIKYKYLLDNYRRYPVFIDSENRILSMPPIINSEETGRIDENTKEVFIEVSGFDFDVLSICLNIVATALSDMKGEIYQVDVKYGNKFTSTPNFSEKIMNIDLNYVNKILGLNLLEKDMKKYLEMMGYGCNNKKVLIPCYRSDVIHQIDLAKDIAIAYGFENFKEEIPKIDTIGYEDRFENFKEKIAGILIGFGLMETNSYNLIGKQEQLGNMKIDANVVEISNSNEEFNTLRYWMIPSLLKVLSNNKHNEYPQKIFEIGNCYGIGKSETNVDEFSELGVMISHNKADFTEAKQILDSLLGLFGFEYSVEESDHKSFIAGRCAKIIVKGKEIAYMGEINPEIIVNFNLEMPASGLELNLTELFKLIE